MLSLCPYIFRSHFQVVAGVKGGCKRYRQTAEGLKDSEEDRKGPEHFAKRDSGWKAPRALFVGIPLDRTCPKRGARCGKEQCFDIQRSVVGGFDFLSFYCWVMLPSEDGFAASS